MKWCDIKVLGVTSYTFQSKMWILKFLMPCW